ncbi:hypothetical protein DXG01_002503 [Tephrocybe rancida]|nr:hypothetical protein DXG01_002503 [Tephrocybe rancida]
MVPTEREQVNIKATPAVSLDSAAPAQLPSHLSDLKKALWKEELLQSWKDILVELDAEVEAISSKGGDIIPRVSFSDIQAGLSESQVQAIKDVGVVIVTGGVPQEEALGWKNSIVQYADVNRAHVTGYPAENIQIYEMYNSKGQVSGRVHPAIVETQRFLLSLWHTSWPNTQIDLGVPVSYFDRVRIRQAGDNTFVLDPHIDNGSVERWEDPTYRQCYQEILKGGDSWKNHDAFDVSPRLDAVQDMYDCSNQGSIFRAWQGWTSMSRTGPGEGTLRVLPMLRLAIPYIILRPFFRFDGDDWVVDLDNPAFPGSLLGGKQFLTVQTHPHLKLDKTMVGIPTIDPGDQVYWHCDIVHEVEGYHHGKNDSSVIYIPAVPLTIKTSVLFLMLMYAPSARYLRAQRATFEAGLPAPDFPKGPGESQCVGRATPADISSLEGRRAFGLEPFEVNEGGDPNFIKTVNDILFSPSQDTGL